MSAKVRCLRLGPKKTRLRFLSLYSANSSRLHFLNLFQKFLRIKGINLDAFLLKPFPSERKALSYLRGLFYQHTLYWPFHSKDLISNSVYSLPYNSYDVSSKNLVLNQLIIPKLIFFLILVICLFDIVMIW